MEIVIRKSHTTITEATSEWSETEVGLSGLDNTLAGVLAIAIAGGIYLSGHDFERLVINEQLKGVGKVDLAASATVLSPVRRRYDFDALVERARELARGARQWVTEKVLEHHVGVVAAVNVTLNASAADGQTEFKWEELTGEDILAMVDHHGGVAIVERDPASGVIDSIAASFIELDEYDPAEMQEVLESLEATGSTTPKKLVGDLAQTSITTTTGQEQVISLAEWTLSWKRKTVDATTTDDADYEASLASTKSWTAKAKFMFVDGDQSQVDAVLSAIDTTSAGPLPWNFFPTVETGRAAFTGTAIIDGIDIGSGSGKIVGLDVSLKGTGPLVRKVQTVPIANANTATGLSGQV